MAFKMHLLDIYPISKKKKEMKNLFFSVTDLNNNIQIKFYMRKSNNHMLFLIYQFLLHNYHYYN
ncbi:hypothetical protein DERP_003397 [Dermatophagoides pteronyssinus]|uniref:Uncharacterized protein n=1 Tax=Dermatophagoides pteronyssinus TaxID=6956 RepID=A0ABQ8JJE4_DERPT|nr:hypothetical protein DERP_003397 [Dermatophagoides pteronyssinus]